MFLQKHLHHSVLFLRLPAQRNLEVVSVCLFVCLSVCLSVYLYACLFDILSLSYRLCSTLFLWKGFW